MVANTLPLYRVNHLLCPIPIVWSWLHCGITLWLLCLLQHYCYNNILLQRLICLLLKPETIYTFRLELVLTLLEHESIHDRGHLPNYYHINELYRLFICEIIVFQQDFEDWDDVGLNIPKPVGLLQLYRAGLRSVSSCHTDCTDSSSQTEDSFDFVTYENIVSLILFFDIILFFFFQPLETIILYIDYCWFWPLETIILNEKSTLSIKWVSTIFL